MIAHNDNATTRDHDAAGLFLHRAWDGLALVSFLCVFAVGLFGGY